MTHKGSFQPLLFCDSVRALGFRWMLGWHGGAREGCCASALRQGETPRSALSLPPGSSTQGTALHRPTPDQDPWPRAPWRLPEPPGNAAAPHSTCEDIGAPWPPAPLPPMPLGPTTSFTQGAWCSSKKRCLEWVALLGEPSLHAAAPADGRPPHQQDQGSAHPGETWPQPPETLGRCCSVTRVPPGQNNPDGGTMLAGWWCPLFRLTTRALLGSCCQGRAGPGTQVAEAGGTPVSRHPAGARAALTSTILVAEVGEAPDISQADDLPSYGQDVLQLVVPLPSLQGLVLLLLLLAGLRRHRFAIADGAGDSVIHPTFRRSFLHYVQHKPCNEAEIWATGGKSSL